MFLSESTAWKTIICIRIHINSLIYEKNLLENILKSYLKFGTWAQSEGILYKDWYKDKEGYRNEALIYKETD